MKKILASIPMALVPVCVAIPAVAQEACKMTQVAKPLSLADLPKATVRTPW